MQIKVEDLYLLIEYPPDFQHRYAVDAYILLQGTITSNHIKGARTHKNEQQSMRNPPEILIFPERITPEIS